MLAWFARFVPVAAVLLVLAAAGSGAPGVLRQSMSALNALHSWAQSDGPAVTRAAFIVTGGPVRPGRD